MLSQRHKQRTHRYNKPISVTTFWFALMNLRPTALKPYHMNNCHQWSQLKLHFSKFHNIQEYRMRLQNNFDCNICLLGFSFIPFLHKNCRTRKRYMHLLLAIIVVFQYAIWLLIFCRHSQASWVKSVESQSYISQVP